jgi:peptidoglycan biosynthesis protein MviN/MurJ (putative lipid II flippase)
MTIQSYHAFKISSPTCGSTTAYARHEIFTAMRIHIVVFWVMTLCGVVIGYKSYGGTCFLRLQAVRSSETLVSYIAIRRQNAEVYDMNHHSPEIMRLASFIHQGADKYL